MNTCVIEEPSVGIVIGDGSLPSGSPAIVFGYAQNSIVKSPSNERSLDVSNVKLSLVPSKYTAPSVTFVSSELNATPDGVSGSISGLVDAGIKSLVYFVAP